VKAAAAPSAARWERWLAALMKAALVALLAIAIIDMLAGVFLRYVVTAITDYFDWPGVSFFWAEGVGELALCWLTFIGAAVAILERTHFALAMLTHRFPPRLQRATERLGHLVIAVFGAITACYGWKVAALNSVLLSATLQINLAYLYAAAVVGGGLIAFYGVAVAAGVIRPQPQPIAAAPE